MPNSGHGECLGTRVMTILGFYVSAQIPNIEYLKYMVVYRPREVSHLFSREIFRRMPSESCLGPIFGQSYDHIYKTIHLGQILTFGNALGSKI